MDYHQGGCIKTLANWEQYESHILYSRLAFITIGPVVFWLVLALRLASITLSNTLPIKMVIDKRYRYSLSWDVGSVSQMESAHVTSAGYSRYGHNIHCLFPWYALPELSTD